jgi:hypothetical protein
MYIIKLSYYCYEIEYAFIYGRHRTDFSEVLLHHVMTIALVVFSYSTNFLAIGCVVMLCLDCSDIFVCNFKIMADTTVKLTWVSYSLLFSSWAYLRMYVFPVLIVYPFSLFWNMDHPM